jgi:hypothetical protein
LLHARQSFAANIASGLPLHGFFRSRAAFGEGFAIPPQLLRIKPLRRGRQSRQNANAPSRREARAMLFPVPFGDMELVTP